MSASRPVPASICLNRGAFALDPDEARIVAGFLLHRMDGPTRGILAANFPTFYNKICGVDRMAVAWRLDGAVATPRGDHGTPILLDSAKLRE